MKPILLEFDLPLLGQTTFPAYFTLLTFGFAMAMLITVREAKKLDLDPQEVLDINLYMVIFGILGARVLHLIADGHAMDYVNLCLDPKQVKVTDALVKHCVTAKECGYDYLCDTARGTCYPPRDCLAWAKIWRGGLAYYGGLIMASAYCIYYTRRHRISTWKIGDLAAPAIMLGLFFGRLGCYLNGCCYGKETASRWGIRFPIGSAPWRVQYEAHHIQVWEQMRPVHATQLYESLGCLMLFGVLYYLVRPYKRREGQVFGAMLILYGVLRSLCEIFRDDERGVLWGWLSTSQILSAPLLIGGLWLVFVRGKSAPTGATDPRPSSQTAG